MKLSELGIQDLAFPARAAQTPPAEDTFFADLTVRVEQTLKGAMGKGGAFQRRKGELLACTFQEGVVAVMRSPSYIRPLIAVWSENGAESTAKIPCTAKLLRHILALVQQTRRRRFGRIALRELFALFFYNFSTFLGRAGLYLEDLYVRPEHRGKGYGKALLKRLAQIAVERGCGRLEWWCLDWNRPSIDFYLAMGAEPMSDWTVYRVAGEALNNLARPV